MVCVHSCKQSHTFRIVFSVIELGLREPLVSHPYHTNTHTNTSSNDNFPQRGYSTSSQQMTTGKGSTSNVGNTKGNLTTNGIDTPRTEPPTPIPIHNQTTNNKTNQSQSGSYVEQVSIAIDAEKCVSQILFDRILDSKSNRKRLLDIKQLVEPWLHFIQQNVKKNDGVHSLTFSR